MSYKKELTQLIGEHNYSSETCRKKLEALRFWKHHLVVKPYKKLKHNIGVFSDTHFPFEHPNFLEFIYDTFNKYQVKEIVHCGDLCDNHSTSRHDSSPNSLGQKLEVQQARKSIEKYARMFPQLTLCLGNHDSIPYRQAATLGFSEDYMRPFEQFWELPTEWRVVEKYNEYNILFSHGIGATGKNGALNFAINQRMNTVTGHAHSFAGVKTHANDNDIIFGMNVGCGIDVDAYAFEYGKFAKNKPVLGCGIITPEGATFIPMGEKYFRS